MARECAACTGPREQIDAELLAGTPAAKISAKFEISAQSVSRHNRNHLLRTGLWEGRATDEVSTSDIIALMASSVPDLAALRDDARKRGDTKSLLAAVREIRGLEPVLERSGITESSLGDELKARDRLVQAVKSASRTRPDFARELATAMHRINDHDTAEQLELLAELLETKQKEEAAA